jgi:hypothetical protein
MNTTNRTGSACSVGKPHVNGNGSQIKDPPHRKGDGAAGPLPKLAPWATEVRYRFDVLQTVRFVALRRLPIRATFTTEDVATELKDRELPIFATTIQWALGEGTRLKWCRPTVRPGLYLPLIGVKHV